MKRRREKEREEDKTREDRRREEVSIVKIRGCLEVGFGLLTASLAF